MTQALTGEYIPAQVEPWNRLPTEGPEAFEAFCTYRDMPLGARSLASVGRTLGKSTALMERWSSEHNWLLRMREYDRYLDRIKMRELEAQYVEMGRRQGQQAAELAEMLMYPARQLVKRMTDDPVKFAKEMDSLPIADALDMAVKAARVWPQVMKAERLAHGLSTENIGNEIDGAIEHVVRIEDGTDPVAYLRAIAELASNGGDSATNDE